MEPSNNDPAKALEYFERKMSFTTGPLDLERAMREGRVQVIDVRAAEDYEHAHIPGSLSLPKERWHTRQGLRKDKLNILLCYSQVCHLAAKAAVEFARQGYRVAELEGGFQGWKDAGLPIEGNTPWSQAALA